MYFTSLHLYDAFQKLKQPQYPHLNLEDFVYNVSGQNMRELDDKAQKLMKEFYEFFLLKSEASYGEISQKFSWYTNSGLGIDDSDSSESDEGEQSDVYYEDGENDFTVVPQEIFTTPTQNFSFTTIDPEVPQTKMPSFFEKKKESTFKSLEENVSTAESFSAINDEKISNPNDSLKTTEQISNEKFLESILNGTFKGNDMYGVNSYNQPSLVPDRKPEIDSSLSDFQAQEKEVATINTLIFNIDIKSSQQFFTGAEELFATLFQDLEKKNILSVAVKNRIRQRGIIYMNSNTGAVNYPLETTIVDVDSFGEFSFDCFQDVCQIYLTQENKENFPHSWKLSESAVIKVCEKINYHADKAIVGEGNKTKFNYIESSNMQEGDDNDLVRFIGRICIKEGKNRSAHWLKILRELEVDTVEDLKKWTMKDWESRPTIKPNFKMSLLKELEELKKGSSGKKKEKKTKAIKESELIGKLHNIKRYFYYHANRIEEIPLLDAKAIEKGFEALKENYQGEVLLQDIHSRFFKIFEFSNIKGVKSPKGLLLYGPPGTGKTQISSALPSLIGLTEVVQAIASTEVNRSLVGETEKILLDLCSRAHRIPHLAACIAIDEIDNLAPKRGDDTSQGKKDALAMLLAVLGGIKNVPNLVFLASTNLRNDIDEAFLRRMRGQFFVGRPNPASREGFFQKLNNYFPIDKDTMSYLVSITCNFTGAALEELNSDIIVKMLSLGKNTGSPLDKKLAIKCAADICDQFPSLLIGKYNLPELFTRQTIPTPIGLPKAEYTGRIIVDLSGSSCVLRYSLEKEDNNIVLPLFFEAFPDTNVDTILMPQSLVSSSKILPYFATFAKKLNIDIIQLIDLNVLMRNNAFDDKEIKEVLNERMDEVANYKKTLVIFDLDSLVGVSMNQSDSSMGVSKSTSVHNVGTFITIIHYFLECYYNEKDTEKMRWTCVVSSNAYLIEAFKEATKFEKSLTEKEYDEKMSKENDPRTCLSCKTKYIPAENSKNPSGCEFHPGFLYDAKNMNAKVLEDKVQDYIAKHPDNSLLYICCGQPMSSKGCECDYHDSEKCCKAIMARKLNTVYLKRYSKYQGHSIDQFEKTLGSRKRF